MELRRVQSKQCNWLCTFVVLLGLSGLVVPIHAARQKRGSAGSAASRVKHAEAYCEGLEREQSTVGSSQHTTLLGAMAGAGNQQQHTGVKQNSNQDARHIRVLCYDTNGRIDAVGINGYLPTAADLAACEGIYNADKKAGTRSGSPSSVDDHTTAQDKQHAAQLPLDSCYMPPSPAVANQHSQDLATNEGDPQTKSEYTANDIIAISSVWMMALLFIYCCATKASRHWRKLGSKRGRKMPGNTNLHHMQRSWINKSLIFVYRTSHSPLLQSISVLSVLTAACISPILMVYLKGFATAAITALIIHSMFKSLVSWLYSNLPTASSIGQVSYQSLCSLAVLLVSLLQEFLWTYPVLCFTTSCTWCVQCLGRVWKLLRHVRSLLVHEKVSVIVTADSLDSNLSGWSTSTLGSSSSGSSSSNASSVSSSSCTDNAGISYIVRRTSSSGSKRGGSQSKQQRQQQQQQPQVDTLASKLTTATTSSSSGDSSSKPTASPKHSGTTPWEQPSTAAADPQCKPVLKVSTSTGSNTVVAPVDVGGSNSGTSSNGGSSSTSSSNGGVAASPKVVKGITNSPCKGPLPQQQKQKQQRQKQQPACLAADLTQQQKRSTQQAACDAATPTPPVAVSSSSASATVATAAEMDDSIDTTVTAAHAAAAAAMVALPSPVADAGSSGSSSRKRDQDTTTLKRPVDNCSKDVAIVKKSSDATAARSRPSPSHLSLALQDDVATDQHVAPASRTITTSSSSEIKTNTAAAAAATAAMQGELSISPTMANAAPPTPTAVPNRCSSSGSSSSNSARNAAVLSPPSTPITPSALPADFLAFAGDSSSSSAVDALAEPALTAAAGSSGREAALQDPMSPCKDTGYCMRDSSSSGGSNDVGRTMRPKSLLPPGYAAAAAAAAADFGYEPSAVHNVPSLAAAAEDVTCKTAANKHLAAAVAAAVAAAAMEVAALPSATACIESSNAPAAANAQQQSPYVLFSDSAPPLQAALAAVTASTPSSSPSAAVAAAKPSAFDPPIALAAAAAVGEPVAEPQRPNLYAGLQHCQPAAAAGVHSSRLSSATMTSGSSSLSSTMPAAAAAAAAAARPSSGLKPNPFSSAAAAIATIAAAATPAPQKAPSAVAVAGTNAVPATLSPPNANSSSSGPVMHSVVWSVKGSTLPPMLPVLPAFVPSVGGIVQQLSQQLSGWLSTDSVHRLLPGDLFTEDDGDHASSKSTANDERQSSNEA